MPLSPKGLSPSVALLQLIATANHNLSESLPLIFAISWWVFFYLHHCLLWSLTIALYETSTADFTVVRVPSMTSLICFFRTVLSVFLPLLLQWCSIPVNYGYSQESHPFQSLTIQITTIRLNRDNFLCWSQSVRLYIRGQGKIGYIIGEKTSPKLDNPLFAAWDSKNSMVEHIN